MAKTMLQAMRGVAAVFAVSAATTGSAEINETTPTDYGFSRILEIDGDQYQVFAYTNTTETWTAPIPDGVTSVEYLVVGGGGGGGTAGDGRGGGGGGAGGFLSGELAVTPGASLSVTVGAGGAAGKPGSASVLGSVEAWGGGAGNSGEGASGGGAQGWSNAAGGVAKEDGAQGFPGCPDLGQHKFGGGGGGGAASAGANGSANSNNGTAGGAGKSSDITGEPAVYAAGGGGGTHSTGKGSAGAGGSDGVGGRGGSSKGSATAGQVNTGSGGGGGTYNLDGNAGAAGADGIVVVRYLIPGKTSFTGATLTINPSTVVYDGNFQEVKLTGITLKDGTVVDLSQVKEGQDYELSQKSFGPSVGVYEVELIGVGESYSGRAVATFEITEPRLAILEETATDYGLTRLIKQNGKKYVVEIYTNETESFEFTVPKRVTELQYLAVGGGGAGGDRLVTGGAGGGAGGFVEASLPVVKGDVLTVSVGAGGYTKQGLPALANGNPSTVALNGETVVTALGGGRGGTPKEGNWKAGSGGSGGGAAWPGSDKFTAGGEGDEEQGCNGGSTSTTGSGGGGGAGSVGESKTDLGGGNGGEGKVSYITGEKSWYAAGGGGAGYRNGSVAGKGGSGIGGDAGTVDVPTGTDGAPNTGSGGGGNYYGNNRLQISGKGGSGIVVLRYRVAESGLKLILR